jgi:hypothetical protein
MKVNYFGVSSLLKSLSDFVLTRIGLMFNFEEGSGFQTAQMKPIYQGASHAFGMCGAASNCAGGGGRCGAASNCAGGGGRCGAASNCAGS